MGGLMAFTWAEASAMDDDHGELEVYMPQRAFGALWLLLRRQGLKVTPQNVAGLTAKQLLAQENFGRVSLQDVREWLAGYGLRLQIDFVPIGNPRGSMALLADALDVLHA